MSASGLSPTLSLRISATEALGSLNQLYTSLAGIKKQLTELGSSGAAVSLNTAPAITATSELTQMVKTAFASLEKTVETSGKRIEESFGKMTTASRRTGQMIVDDFGNLVKGGEALTAAMEKQAAAQLRIQLRSAEMTGKLAIDRAKAEERAESAWKQSLANRAARVLAQPSSADDPRVAAYYAAQEAEALRRKQEAWEAVEMARAKASERANQQVASGFAALERRTQEIQARESERLQSAVDKEVAAYVDGQRRKTAAAALEAQRRIEQQQKEAAAAQLRGTTLNLAGARAASVANLESGFAYGPNRQDWYRLQDAHTLRQSQEAARAGREGNLAPQINAVRQLTEAQREAHSAARGLASGLGAIWLTWGSVVPLLAGAAVSHGLHEAAKAGADFQYQLTLIKALAEETGTSITEMGAKVKEISKGSLYSPAEALQGFRTLVTAGLDVSQAQQALPSVLRLATVGELDVKEAALTATAAMHAFKMESTDIERIGETLSKAAAISATDVRSMAASFRYASTVADQYGLKLNEVSEGLVLLAQRGIIGTSAGTAFRNMMNELAAPTDKARKILAAIGVDAYDGTNKLKPLVQIIDTLRQKFSRYDQRTQNDILDIVFGERGAKEASAYLSATPETLRKIRSELDYTTGFMLKTVKELEGTVGGEMTQAFNNLKRTLLDVFDSAEPGVRKLAVSFKELAGSQELLNFFQTVARIVLDVTQFLVDHHKALLLVTAGYVGLRTAALAEGGLLLMGQALGGHSAKAQAAAASTHTLKTAMVEASGAAAITAGNLTATGASAASALSKFAAGAGIFLRAAGWVGLLGTVLWEVSSLLFNHEKAGEAAARGEETAQSSYEKSIALLDKEIAQLKERERLLTKGVENKEEETLQDAFVAAARRYDEKGRAWDKALKEGRDVGPDSLEGAELFTAVIEYKRIERRALEASARRSHIKEMEDKRDEERRKEFSKRFGTDKLDIDKLLGRGDKAAERLNRAQANSDLSLYSNKQRQAEQRFGDQQKLLDARFRAQLISEDDYQKQLRNIEKNRLATQQDLLEEERDALKDELAKATPADKVNIKSRLRDTEFRLEQAREAAATAAELHTINFAGQINKLGLGGVETITKSQLDFQQGLRKREQDTRAGLLSSTDAKALAEDLKVVAFWEDQIRKIEGEVRGLSEDDPRVRMARTLQAEMRETAEIQRKLTAESVRGAEEIQRSWKYGAQQAFTQYVDSASNAAEQARSVFQVAARGMEEAILKFATTGKLSFRDFANSVIHELLRIQAQKTAAGILTWIGQIVGGSFFGGTGAGTASLPAPSDSSWSYTGKVGTKHSGGIAGLVDNPMRVVDLRYFDGAPRLHGGGLVANEVPIIAKKGEGVFTPEQMRALAPVGSGNTAIANINVTVNRDGSAVTTAQDDSRRAGEMAKRVRTVVMEVIAEEQLPGGLLFARG